MIRIRTETKIKCSCCGEEFDSEYGGDGSISHNNVISNIKVNVNWWSNGDDKHKIFLSLIRLDGNYCNIKDNSYKVGLKTYQCCMIWLKKNGPQDMYDYMKSKKSCIKEEYNKITLQYIDELKAEMAKLEKRLIR